MIFWLTLLLALPAAAEEADDAPTSSTPEPQESPDSSPEAPAPQPEPEAAPPAPPPAPVSRPAQGPDHPAPIGPPPPKLAPPRPPPIQAVGEVRINWDFSRVDNLSGEGRGDDFSHGFEVPRVELGLNSRVSRRVDARAVIRLAEDHALIDQDPSLLGESLVPEHPTGWAVQAQDVFATVRPLDTDHFWLRAGVQNTIVGARDYFDVPGQGYYLIGPRTEDVSELAGVVHDREIGLRAHGEIGRALAIDGMVANGNGQTGLGEDNLAKDLSVRVDYGLTETLHVVLSGQRAVDGPEGKLHDLLWSAMTEWRGDGMRAMAEALGGTEDHGGDDVRQFLGGQAGFAMDRSHSGDWLDSKGLAARVGYFDPRIHTVDADAWLTADLSAQGWWRSEGPARFMTGLGYNMWMPMDITQPVAHSVTLQALFKL